MATEKWTRSSEITAWSVPIDPFDLGLQIEAYQCCRRQINAVQQLSRDTSSRLNSLPPEIISTIKKDLYEDSMPLREKWFQWQKYSTTEQRVNGVSILQNTSDPRVQRQYSQAFHSQIFGEPHNCSFNPQAMLWDFALDNIYHDFGVKALFIHRIVADNNNNGHVQWARDTYFAYLLVPTYDSAGGLDRPWRSHYDLTATVEHVRDDYQEENVEKECERRLRRVMSFLNLRAEANPPCPLQMEGLGQDVKTEGEDDIRLTVFSKYFLNTDR